MGANNAFCCWFTGLSGSGKTTLAKELVKTIKALGIPVVFLDGDQLREGLNSNLDFTLESRIENNRRAAEVAKIMLRSGIYVVASFISPTREIRDLVKTIIGSERYVEIFVDTSLGTCIRRDNKGLYKKALKGEIELFTGIHMPFEVPEASDLRIDMTFLNLFTANEVVLNFWQKKKATFDKSTSVEKTSL
ncbi:MAG: adenylyl-sulfate kinase [Marinilabiliaceae bacterium]|nr:adenylyl-sulfate kinase [Marinilabiliaceae bacterium]